MHEGCPACGGTISVGMTSSPPAAAEVAQRHDPGRLDEPVRCAPVGTAPRRHELEPAKPVGSDSERGRTAGGCFRPVAQPGQRRGLPGIEPARGRAACDPGRSERGVVQRDGCQRDVPFDELGAGGMNAHPTGIGGRRPRARRCVGRGRGSPSRCPQGPPGLQRRDPCRRLVAPCPASCPLDIGLLSTRCSECT